MMEEIKVSTLQEYINAIESFSAEYCLSRGQQKDKSLLPGALRSDDDNKRLYSKKTINYFLENFKLNANVYLEKPEIIKSEYDYMVLAQHYGIPTRLLDFTYSHLVSLMFALENAFKYDDNDFSNSVVWFLNPSELNKKSINRTEIVNVSMEGDLKLDEKDFPVAITAVKNNSRIVAQDGVFVFFQHESKPLEQNSSAESFLKKIIIPHDSAKGIMKSLYLLGFRFSNIYPELDSVSKDILLKYNVEQYMQESNDDGE